jgi:hypothetical protein
VVPAGGGRRGGDLSVLGEGLACHRTRHGDRRRVDGTLRNLLALPEVPHRKVNSGRDDRVRYSRLAGEVIRKAPPDKRASDSHRHQIWCPHPLSDSLDSLTTCE